MISIISRSKQATSRQSKPENLQRQITRMHLGLRTAMVGRIIYVKQMRLFQTVAETTELRTIRLRLWNGGLSSSDFKKKTENSKRNMSWQKIVSEKPSKKYWSCKKKWSLIFESKSRTIRIQIQSSRASTVTFKRFCKSTQSTILRLKHRRSEGSKLALHLP